MDSKKVLNYIGTSILTITMSFNPSIIILSHILISYHRHYKRIIRFENNLFIYSFFILSVNFSTIFVNILIKNKKKISIKFVLLISNLCQIMAWLLYYLLDPSTLILFILILIIGFCYGLNVSYSMYNMSSYEKNNYKVPMIFGLISCVVSKLYTLFILMYTNIINDTFVDNDILDRKYFPFVLSRNIHKIILYYALLLSIQMLISFLFITNVNYKGVEEKNDLSINMDVSKLNENNDDPVDEEVEKKIYYGKNEFVVMIPLLAFPIIYKPFIREKEEINKKMFFDNLNKAKYSFRFIKFFISCLFMNFSEEILFSSFIMFVINQKINVITSYKMITWTSLISGVFYFIFYLINKNNHNDNNNNNNDNNYNNKTNYRILIFIKSLLSILICIYAIFIQKYYEIIFSVTIGILFILNQEITNIYLENIFDFDWCVYLFEICSFCKGISSIIGSSFLYFTCGLKLVDKIGFYYLIYSISIFTNIISFFIIFFDDSSEFKYVHKSINELKELDGKSIKEKSS